MPRDVVLHGALLEGTGTQMDKPLERLSSHFKEEGRYFDDEAIRTPATPNPVRQPN